MARRTCNYVGAECLAPAGYRVGGGGMARGTTSTRLSCYICGEPVCASCSRLINWYGKRVRAGYCCKAEEETEA